MNMKILYTKAYTNVRWHHWADGFLNNILGSRAWWNEVALVLSVGWQERSSLASTRLLMEEEGWGGLLELTGDGAKSKTDPWFCDIHSLEFQSLAWSHPSFLNIRLVSTSCQFYLLSISGIWSLFTILVAISVQPLTPNLVYCKRLLIHIHPPGSIFCDAFSLLPPVHAAVAPAISKINFKYLPGMYKVLVIWPLVYLCTSSVFYPTTIQTSCNLLYLWCFCLSCSIWNSGKEIPECFPHTCQPGKLT